MKRLPPVRAPAAPPAETSIRWRADGGRLPCPRFSATCHVLSSIHSNPSESRSVCVTSTKRASISIWLGTTLRTSSTFSKTARFFSVLATTILPIVRTYLMDELSGHCTPMSPKKPFQSAPPPDTPVPSSAMKSPPPPRSSPPPSSDSTRLIFSSTAGSTSYMRTTMSPSGALNGTIMTTLPSIRYLRLATCVTIFSASRSEI